MADSQSPSVKVPDPVEFAKTMARIGDRSRQLVAEFVQKQAETAGKDGASTDPLNIGSAFFELTTRLMADPARLVQAQINLWQDYMSLWQTATRRFFGEQAAPVAEPAPGDRRFKDQAW